MVARGGTEMKWTMVAAMTAMLGAVPAWAQDRPFDPYGDGGEVT